MVQKRNRRRWHVFGRKIVLAVVVLVGGGVLAVLPGSPTAASVGVVPPCVMVQGEIRCSPLYPLPPLCAHCPLVMDLRVNVVLPPVLDGQVSGAIADGVALLMGSYAAGD